jgi:hypothetical protein
MGLMNLFIRVEDKEEPAQTPVKKVVSSPTVAPPVIPVSPPVSSIGQEDVEIKRQLTSALEAANQPGYDYFEFAKSVDAQAALIPGEALRFQSTFAVATAMGLSADKLLSSAQFYLDVLKNKEDEFSSALGKHSKGSIDAKENSIKEIDGQMQVKAEQIKKFTDEINVLQQQKTQMINEVTAAKAEIEKIKNNFYATMKVFTSRISGDVEKIKSYITAGGRV